jgi:hypothetical protein
MALSLRLRLAVTLVSVSVEEWAAYLNLALAGVRECSTCQ